jgi:hypothetical protein
MVVYGRMRTAEFKGRVVEVPYGYHTQQHRHLTGSFSPPPFSGDFFISEILSPRNARWASNLSRGTPLDCGLEGRQQSFVILYTPFLPLTLSASQIHFRGSKYSYHSELIDRSSTLTIASPFFSSLIIHSRLIAGIIHNRSAKNNFATIPNTSAPSLLGFCAIIRTLRL